MIVGTVASQIASTRCPNLLRRSPELVIVIKQVFDIHHKLESYVISDFLK